MRITKKYLDNMGKKDLENKKKRDTKKLEIMEYQKCIHVGNK